jgi:hypothetical protein
LQCAQGDALRQFDLEGIVSERAGITNDVAIADLSPSTSSNEIPRRRFQPP